MQIRSYWALPFFRLLQPCKSALLCIRVIRVLLFRSAAGVFFPSDIDRPYSGTLPSVSRLRSSHFLLPTPVSRLRSSDFLLPTSFPLFSPLSHCSLRPPCYL